MTRSEMAGCSLVELLVALVVLTVGILALTGTGALGARMIGAGRQRTVIAHLLSDRIEWLRAQALHTVPSCAPLASGSLTHPQGIAEHWSITPAGGARSVLVSSVYPSPRGLQADSLLTVISCP